VQRLNNDAATTSPGAKLTGDTSNALEALLIGDCRLFRSLAENTRLRLLGLLQQYRHIPDMALWSLYAHYHFRQRSTLIACTLVRSPLPE